MNDVCVQLINTTTGGRSDPMMTTCETFAEKLNTESDPEILKTTAILVVMEKPKDEWEFSKAPLMNADTFINYFLVNEEQTANG
nr:MAG: hypothetical protein [Microvirus sp.]